MKWIEYDGNGRRVRDSLNLGEHGFGVRAALRVSDRGNTPNWQVNPGDFAPLVAMEAKQLSGTA